MLTQDLSARTRQSIKIGYANFLVSVIVSLILIAFSIYKLVREEQTDTYEKLLFVILGYWLNSALKVKTESSAS